jgi:hypothetical protein
MVALTKGEATKDDFNRLVAAANVVEALYIMGFGKEYKDAMDNGHSALMALGQRGKKIGKLVLKAEELQALNYMMELHDAQLDVITVKHLENAIKMVERERRAGRTKDIV